jgi:dihydroorotase
MQICIRGGTIIDPGNWEGVADIYIQNGKIVDIITTESRDGHPPSAEALDTEIKIIDASGKFVTPGLMDMHVHLREPGQEYKETIASGCQAAAWGGFTAICAMPNTNPVNDNPQVTEYILEKASQVNASRVYPVGAVTRGLAGKHLCNYAELKDAGAIAISDDGMPVMDSRLMRKALENAKQFDLLVISHSEDLSLAAGGVMNEGPLAAQLGLGGIPNASESIMVMRDIALCELTGSPVHIAHVSTAESVRAIRDAKARDIFVTAETAPHYFMLTEDVVKDCHTNAKMNPPLRSHRDREAVREGLADDTIDVIATDHAPHSSKEKDIEFDLAANGIIGLETSVSMGLKLVEDGVITINALIEKMSTRPAHILGIDHGLRIGRIADLTVIDPDIDYRIDAHRFQSLSRNTPFDGWRMRGKPIVTMVAGNIVFEEGIK